ncbi:MAG: hypothetical protein QNK36_20240 [Colwellia sp.]|nr:hypothetical protein [Colwellia sp.]
MSSGNKNHAKMMREISMTLHANSITADVNEPIHFRQQSIQINKCQLVIVGITPEPIRLIKSWAETEATNQSNYYLGSVIDNKDHLIFIYGGSGFKSDKYRLALARFKNILGKNNVVSLDDFDGWVKQKLKEV